MFRKLHNAYTDMVCNPFYVPGEKIMSKYVTIHQLHAHLYKYMVIKKSFVDINLWLHQLFAKK